MSLNSKDQSSLGHDTNIHLLHESDQPCFPASPISQAYWWWGVFPRISSLYLANRKKIHIDSIFILKHISPMKARGLFSQDLIQPLANFKNCNQWKELAMQTKTHHCSHRHIVNLIGESSFIYWFGFLKFLDFNTFETHFLIFLVRFISWKSSLIQSGMCSILQFSHCEEEKNL